MKISILLLALLSVQSGLGNPRLSVTKVNDTTAITYTGKIVSASVAASKAGVAASGTMTLAKTAGKPGSAAAASAASSVSDAGATSSASTAAADKGVAIAVGVAAGKNGTSVSRSMSVGGKSQAGSVTTNPGGPATVTKSSSGSPAGGSNKIIDKVLDSIVKKCHGANEVWTSKGNNNCQITCANCKTMSPDCTDKSKPGCICKPGYLRNWKGECVTESECYVCTGNNERWTDCENDSCQRDCSTFGRKDLFCRPSCNPGCICELGYLRNGNRECVLATDCEQNVCPESYEQYNACPGTEVTCDDILAGNYPAIINGDSTNDDPTQCRPSCVCKKDFVRKSDGTCVLAFVANQCP